MTAESNEVFDRMAVDGLTVAQAKLWLDHVVQRELAKIAKLDAVFANDETPGRSRVERRNHLVHGHALQILAQDGLGAVAGDHEAALAGAGLNEHERAGVARDMDQIRDQLEVTERGLQRDLRTVTGLEDVEPLAWMQARQLYLRGRAAAYLAQDQVATQTRENDAERVLALAKMPSAAEGSLGPGREVLRRVLRRDLARIRWRILKVLKAPFRSRRILDHRQRGRVNRSIDPCRQHRWLPLRPPRQTVQTPTLTSTGP